jgi:hypothetical protein
MAKLKSRDLFFFKIARLYENPRFASHTICSFCFFFFCVFQGFASWLARSIVRSFARCLEARSMVVRAGLEPVAFDGKSRNEVSSLLVVEGRFLPPATGPIGENSE